MLLPSVPSDQVVISQTSNKIGNVRLEFLLGDFIGHEEGIDYFIAAHAGFQIVDNLNANRIGVKCATGGRVKNEPRVADCQRFKPVSIHKTFLLKELILFSPSPVPEQTRLGNEKITKYYKDSAKEGNPFLNNNPSHPSKAKEHRTGKNPKAGYMPPMVHRKAEDFRKLML